MGQDAVTRQLVCQLRKLVIPVMLLIAGACLHERAQIAPVSTAAGEFGFSAPEQQGMDSLPLLDLAKWVRDHPVPIYSILVSRNGKVVFELYTSSIDREAAHYLMSATKSVMSALVGIAIDKKLVASPDISIAEALPQAAFPTAEDKERFSKVSIKDLLGMSVLDTPDPPRVNTPEALARQKAFLGANNRVRFVLGQPILKEPGASFLYNDMGPQIASGIVASAAHRTVLGFAEENLFGPLEFKNYEWMHQDPSGIDNGGYGLRLRPIDMQKFGILFLRKGAWNGRQLVSEKWVETSFTPWNRSVPERKSPDYGWFWWAATHGPGWASHEAHGWKGQRIIVVPEQGVVVTITAYLEGGGEESLSSRIIEDYIIPSVEHGRSRALLPDPNVASDLTRVLAEVHDGPMRGPARPEPRMLPSVEHKGPHSDTVAW